MRILSIGLPLPNPAIDNYSLTSAPSFFDYDAVIVNPAAISQAIEEILRGQGEYRTPDDEAVYDGPTTAGAVGLADIIRHRYHETQRLFDRGGLVVCFAYPNVSHPGVSRFPGCERYSWLPAPAGLDWSRDALLPGFGTEVIITDHEHPFAPVLDRFRDRLAYRAYVADTVRGRIFARSAGGAVIGIEMAVGQGRLVFVPGLRSLSAMDNRFEMADVLVHCCRRAVLDRPREDEPTWAEAYPLPGLDLELAALRDAEVVLEAAQAQVAEFRQRVERLAKYRRLLWQEGRFGLLPVVKEAFELLGFSVSQEEDKPLTIADEGQVVFVEVEGAPEAVDMAPHYRLRRRWEEELATSGQTRRGVIVINGYRLQRPDERPQQYHEALRIAAEALHYCLITSSDLFRIVQWALGDADEEQRRAVRRRILETEGVFTLPPSLLAERAPAQAHADQSDKG